MFKKFKLTKFDWFLLLSVLFVGVANASGGGSGMPWESGIETVQESLTGPVAKAICLIGIVGSGIMLIWGRRSFRIFENRRICNPGYQPDHGCKYHS